MCCCLSPVRTVDMIPSLELPLRILRPVVASRTTAISQRTVGIELSVLFTGRLRELQLVQGAVSSSSMSHCFIGGHDSLTGIPVMAFL